MFTELQQSHSYTMTRPKGHDKQRKAMPGPKTSGFIVSHGHTGDEVTKIRVAVIEGSQ